jgi:hypothetical protein
MFVIMLHQRSNKSHVDLIRQIALTYYDFRENAHRCEGYAARDVP